MSHCDEKASSRATLSSASLARIPHRHHFPSAELFLDAYEFSILNEKEELPQDFPRQNATLLPQVPPLRDLFLHNLPCCSGLLEMPILDPKTINIYTNKLRWFCSLVETLAVLLFLTAYCSELQYPQRYEKWRSEQKPYKSSPPPSEHTQLEYYS